MADYEADMDDGAETGAPVAEDVGAKGNRKPDEPERRLVAKITKRVREDRKHHSEAFKRMRRDGKLARRGAPDDWPKDDYVANLIGRHMAQKTAALYAKNPKAIARRREKLDFAVWDESEQSLLMALQAVQMATQPQVDPMTGVMLPPDPMLQMNPAVMQAQALLQDYEQGMMMRQQIEKIGKTLEILFAYYTAEQTPLDFKTSMKHLVRRACTMGVGYLKIGFQREMEADPQVQERLADFQTRLQHIQQLSEESQDGDVDDREVKERELKHAIESLQSQEYVLIREGLVFDFPDSTRVIPDKMCRALAGFVGARWLSVEYLYTPEEVKRIFGVDLGKNYTAYADDGTYRTDDEPELDFSNGTAEDEARKGNLVCVWEHYDKVAGVVYLVCDGYPAFLRPPSAPDIYVEDFWPVYALTFNDVEDPSCLFPPSDVELMFPMQMEYNRARQGLREHRNAARPRFAAPKGVLGDEDKMRVASAKPFDVVELNIAVDQAIANVLQAFPMPGVDPNLYETGQLFTDVQLVVGAQEAQFGAVAKATATESSIAESSRIASVDSNVDDLDSFLTRIARASGQVLLRELNEETVRKIAGPGAVWPQMTLDQIAEEIFLEIEAGSSGKPNQAQEIRNWKEMLPFLLQMPNIQPTWLARETLRRLDDRMDLTEAITENIPAIVAQNRMAGAAPAPGAMPEDQGGAGADNASVPGGPTGSDAPLANNQQAVM